MATGTDSFMGKAMPIVGNTQLTSETAADDVFTITGVSSQTGDFLVIENSSGTEHFYIEDDGVTNWAIAKTVADNALALTLTDGSTLTSGYVQGYYVSLTTSGSYSTGSCQINAIAADVSLGGTIAVEASGMYIYVAPSGSPTVTNGNISCATFYLMDMGAAPSYQSVLNLYKNTTNSGATFDGFIFCVNQGSGTASALIGVGGTNHPSYFLKTQSAQGSGKMIQTITAAGTTDKVLVCNINGSTYWIPLYAASA